MYLNVIRYGDFGPLVPGSSRPATSACCVYTVTELTNEYCFIHTPTPTPHTQYFTIMRDTNSYYTFLISHLIFKTNPFRKINI